MVITPSGGLVMWVGTPPRRPQGFTMIEMIVVMIIVSVIAAVGVSRFADNSLFQTRRAADITVSALRGAQQLAVAQRKTIYVQLAAAGTMILCLDAACVSPVTPPSTISADGTHWLVLNDGIMFSTSQSFSFDSVGRPSFTSMLTLVLQLPGGVDAHKHVEIEPETGYVRAIDL